VNTILRSDNDTCVIIRTFPERKDLFFCGYFGEEHRQNNHMRGKPTIFVRRAANACCGSKRNTDA
jgi:hypothetical protein